MNEKKLVIEFGPTIGQQINKVAEVFGLDTGEFIVLCIESLLRTHLKRDPICPLSSQLVPSIEQEHSTFADQFKYILRLFIAWSKAKRGKLGHQIAQTTCKSNEQEALGEQVTEGFTDLLTGSNLTLQAA